MSSLLKSTGLAGTATLLSRVLGLVRETVFAAYFGRGLIMDAWVQAFMIPNLFRRLLGEGALTAAFIPIFKRKLETESEAASWRAANAVISGLTLVALGLIALVLLGATVALEWFDLGIKTELMLRLLRVVFPYMAFVCIAATFMGMLNARGSFFVPALGATILNVIVIAAIFLFGPDYPKDLGEYEGGFDDPRITGIFVVAVAVALAGAAQALYMLPSLWRLGYRPQWIHPWSNPVVSSVINKMLPGILGVAAYQINMVVSISYANSVGTGIAAGFTYAVRLMEFPQGIFGISLCAFMLPTLSGFAAKKNYADYLQTLGKGLNYLLFVNLVVMMITIALAEPIVRLVFERGAFRPDDTFVVSRVLVTLAISLVGYSFCALLARAFYALEDVKTPMMISVMFMGMNLVLVFLLTPGAGAMGLAAANSVTSLLQAGVLIWALKKKMGSHWTPLNLMKPLLTLTPIAMIAGFGAWGALNAIEGVEVGHRLLDRAISVFFPMGVGLALYALMTSGLSLEAPREIRQAIVNRLRRLRR